MAEPLSNDEQGPSQATSVFEQFAITAIFEDHVFPLLNPKDLIRVSHVTHVLRKIAIR